MILARKKDLECDYLIDALKKGDCPILHLNSHVASKNYFVVCISDDFEMIGRNKEVVDASLHTAKELIAKIGINTSNSLEEKVKSLEEENDLLRKLLKKVI